MFLEGCTMWHFITWTNLAMSYKGQIINELINLFYYYFLNYYYKYFILMAVAPHDLDLCNEWTNILIAQTNNVNTAK